MEKKLDLTIPSLAISTSLLEYTNIPEATRQGLLDLDLLLNESIKRMNQDVAQKQGFIYEYLESYKFNQAASLNGEEFRSFVTSSIKGFGTHPSDIVVAAKDLKDIEIVNKALAHFQLKSSSSHMYPLKEFFRSDYSGMKKVTNPEHVNRIKELYEKRYLAGNIYKERYEELLKSVEDGISYKGIKSGGTSYDEVLYVTENTEEFIKNEKLKLYVREGGSLVLFSVGTSFALTLAVETLSRKEIDREAVSKSFKAAGRSGIVSFLSYILKKELNNILIAGAIANTVVTGVESLYLVVKDEISAKEGVLNIARTATESLNSAYFAGVGTVVAGPIGTIIGGLLGYAFGHISFNFLEALIKENQVKNEKRKEIILASKVFEEDLKRRTDLLLLHLVYLEELFKEGDEILKKYIQTDNEEYLDKFCNLFSLKKEEDFENRFFSKDPLIL